MFRPLLLYTVSFAACLFSFGVQVGGADDLDLCRQLWLRGEYKKCAETAGRHLTRRFPGQDRYAEWQARAQAATGDYHSACQTLIDSLKVGPSEIRNRWLLIQLLPYSGSEELREGFVRDIEHLVQSSAWRYTQDSENLVVLSEFALFQHADAKQVQSVMLDRARQLEPGKIAPLLASGRLALEKHDFALAAESFRAGLKLEPNNPELLFGLSQSLQESQPRDAEQLLKQTLQQNPRFADAILVQVESLIDREDYEQAFQRAADLLKTNPQHALALALQSVIRALQQEEGKASDLRKLALSTWKKNPHVDHLIGKKLSQKYRFKEGAAAQQQSLQFDPEFLLAKKQLSLDLLRLGREVEGWELADEVYQQDQYDVATYNLITLRDEIENFTTIQRDGFHLRMEKREAEIYGERAAALIQQARAELCRKYDCQLPDTVLIEIFPKPADFAVRTFGMPGAGGYLGVCFGNVITAKSPASQNTNPVNWESVLWHEFAHVVTLNKTRNRMPRWLSEGISVYEERQRNPTWGERMTPAYRKMILEGQLTPIGELSGAFLSPRSPQHLMFAYYESSLVVEYLRKTYGLPTLLEVLNDLGSGIPINTALDRRYVPLPELEKDFEDYVKIQTHLYGWYIDWTPADFSRILEGDQPAAGLIAWCRSHPRNYLGLKACGELLERMGQTEQALDVFRKAVLLFPDETGAESVFAKLTALEQRLGNAAAEQAACDAWTRTDDAAAPAFLRLMEINRTKENWPGVQDAAEKLVAVKPLIPQPYEGLAAVAENADQHLQAISALKVLLLLDPVDPADLYYRLAVQLEATDDRIAARRAVLKSLETAPRYRAALELLLQIHDQPKVSSEEGKRSDGAEKKDDR